MILDANVTQARPWLTTVIDDYSRAVCPLENPESGADAAG
jgi:hypothetical protein